MSRYYATKLREHGPTPAGVDWNGAASQRTRFAQLLKLCDPDLAGSVLDYGCGYGALFGYLREHRWPLRYVGYDLSQEMVSAARALYSQDAEFFADRARIQPADYALASGVLNVKAGVADHQWWAYCEHVLADLSLLGRRGFAFNALTRYSDPERMRPDLYYADPCQVFDYCKRRFSTAVALLHDYGLYEFTILVRT